MLTAAAAATCKNEKVSRVRPPSLSSSPVFTSHLVTVLNNSANDTRHLTSVVHAEINPSHSTHGTRYTVHGTRHTIWYFYIQWVGRNSSVTMWLILMTVNLIHAMHVNIKYASRKRKKAHGIFHNHLLLTHSFSLTFYDIRTDLGFLRIHKLQLVVAAIVTRISETKWTEII